MLNSVGERTPAWGTPVLKCRCIDVWFLYFVSLDVVSFMIVPGMLICSSFLISLCMFIVSKALLMCTASDCSRRGSHLVEPLCYGVI